MKTKAKSIYDFETVKALTHVMTYKKKKPKRTFLFWNLYVFVMLAVILLMMHYNVGDDLGWLLVLIVVIIVLNCFLYWGMPRIQYKALVKMQGMENDFVFCEDVIKIISKNDEYQGEAEIKYSMIPKVMETSKFFFIFQSKNQVYIVDKSMIVNGTSEDIRDKLKTIAKNKYVVCKY